jgi:hypothetical protein
VKLALLAVTVAAVGAAAVVWLAGDDGGRTAPAPAASSRTASAGAASVAGGSWEVNADVACATLLERFDSAMHPGARSGVEVFEEAARLGHTDLTMFKRLRPPAESRVGADVIAAALAVQLIALEELAQAEDESNEARARIALDRARDARRRARPFAEGLGLRACAAEASRR